MRTLINSIAWGMILVAATGAGRVETRDGKSIDGDVSFADGAVVVRPATGPETRLPLDRVRRASMRIVPQPAIEVAPAGGQLPPGWKAQDVGRVFKPGSATCDPSGRFKLTASGWGAWGAADSLHGVFRPLEGDGQILAHVAKLDDKEGAVAAGVMIRQSAAADAPMVSVSLTSTGDIRMARRPPGAAPELKKVDDQAPKAWLRLTRRGDLFTSYRSADGKGWEMVEARRLPMDAQAVVGIGCWTTGNAWTGGATIDSVMVAPGTPGASFFPTGDPLLEGLVLRDGTLLAAKVVSGDAASVRFERGQKGWVLPIGKVGRIVFNPLPGRATDPPERRGILLVNGDYVEGEFTGLTRQSEGYPARTHIKVSIRSVLFGPRHFDAGREVVCVDLGEIKPKPATWEVRLVDNSVLRAAEIELRSGGVLVDGVTYTDVIDINRL